MKLKEMTSKTIVQVIQVKNKLPWLNVTNSALLDFEFYYNYSGDKEVAPIVTGLLNAGKSEIEVLSIVADICIIKYGDKWNKIYNTISSDYDVFSDYYKESNVDTNTNQDTKVTINEDNNTTYKEESSIYAFNSEESVPTDKSNSESNSITNKTANSIQNKANNTGNSKEITKGKLGSASYTDLARKEVDFRLLHNFIEIFLSDISHEMCLSIY